MLRILKKLQSSIMNKWVNITSSWWAIFTNCLYFVCTIILLLYLTANDNHLSLSLSLSISLSLSLSLYIYIYLYLSLSIFLTSSDNFSPPISIHTIPPLYFRCIHPLFSLSLSVSLSLFCSLPLLSYIPSVPLFLLPYIFDITCVGLLIFMQWIIRCIFRYVNTIFYLYNLCL